MIASFIFYMFAAVLLGSAIATVTVRQPVTSVLCMILCFFNAAGLFLFLGAEFLAFILLIVYVGAVAVLFLFVVMMLDVKGMKPKATLRKHLPIGIGLGGVLLTQMIIVATTWPKIETPELQAPVEQIDNTRALGHVLYTDYGFLFQVSGMILLVAMIGAILLTLRERRPIKRQNYRDQLDRRREDVVEIRKVKSGEGVL